MAKILWSLRLAWRRHLLCNIRICYSAFAACFITWDCALGIFTFIKFIGLTSVRVYFILLPILFAVILASLGAENAVAGLIASLAIAFLRPSRLAHLAFLGTISYSLYLVHVPLGGRIVNLGARFAYNEATQVLVLAVAVAISIATAYLMYRFVARPMLKCLASLADTNKSKGRSHLGA